MTPVTFNIFKNKNFIQLKKKKRKMDEMKTVLL